MTCFAILCADQTSIQVKLVYSPNIVMNIFHPNANEKLIPSGSNITGRATEFEMMIIYVIIINVMIIFLASVSTSNTSRPDGINDYL